MCIHVSYYSVCITLQAPLAEGRQWIDDSFSANQSAVFIKQSDFSSCLSPYCGTHWAAPDKVILEVLSTCFVSDA
jgi:hypothetical protein